MGCTYLDEEVLTFLELIVETQSLKRIDGKSTSNIKVFDSLSEKVYRNENPHEWEVKSGAQWRVKWKALKTKYNCLKTEASKSGEWVQVCLIFQHHY